MPRQKRVRRKKEIAPTVESMREFVKRDGESVTPWTDKAQLAIVVAWVLFAVLGIALVLI